VTRGVQVGQLDWSASAGTGDYHLGDAIYGASILSDSTNSGAFRLNGVEVGAQTNTPPPDLDFNGIKLTITDGDGDTATETFNVHIGGTTGDHLTVEAIAGTSGADNLVGTSGNDVLIGGPGNDTLTGNGGNDIFVLNSTAAANGHDIMSDFNAGDSIVVDVANQNLTIDTAPAVAFNSGATGANDQTHDSAFTGSNFFFNTTTNELYYSADNTAAHAVDLAKISTGVPAANAVHVM
jgi:Ca2+-binding RTX toxin-like protein